MRKYAGEQEFLWDGQKDCKHDWEIWKQKTPNASGGSSPKQDSVRGAHHVDYKDRTRQQTECKLCGAWRGAFGHEPTVEMYVQHTVEILREIRRVLRKDGVCFWNIGDSYFNCTYIREKASDAFGNAPGYKAADGGGVSGGKRRSMAKNMANLKMKDLCLIPDRVRLAAQADGWWVRSNIVWVKPNPMPESITDRPTRSYEDIIMLTKSAHYFWDKDAVAEEQTASSRERAKYGWHGRTDDMRGGARTGSTFKKMAEGDGLIATIPENGRRNIRNVWTFPTQPYRGAHFAVFPEELPRRCIMAATSVKGACRFCGTPWERVAKNSYINRRPKSRKDGRPYPSEVGAGGTNGTGKTTLTHEISVQTIGWRPTCECRGQHDRTVPCVVLDPFAGSGTTGRVATKLNRSAILLDIAYTKGAYLELAQKRNEEVQTTLLLEG